jgi:hypothetical protein
MKVKTGNTSGVMNEVYTHKDILFYFIQMDMGVYEKSNKKRVEKNYDKKKIYIHIYASIGNLICNLYMFF